MPAVLKVTVSGIYRCKDGSSSGGDLVSNFTISLLATVHVGRDAGGSGFLAKVKRFQTELKSKLLNYSISFPMHTLHMHVPI